MREGATRSPVVCRNSSQSRLLEGVSHATEGIRIFTNDVFGTIRTAEHEDRVYFCGRDVATDLGCKDLVNVIKQYGRGVAFRHPVTDAFDTSDLDVEAAGCLAQINDVAKKIQPMMAHSA